MIIRKARTTLALLIVFVKRLYIYLRYPFFKKREIAADSLLRFRFDIHSQVGQDGVIQEIIRRLGIEKGFFIEFGAWDGIHLSNCRNLYLNGWSGAFIEGSVEKYIELMKNYPEKNIYKFNEYVSPYPIFKSLPIPGKELDEILAQEPELIKPFTLDVLVIDIDGADLEVALSNKLLPKVIVLEGGSLFRPEIDSEYPFAYSNCQHPLSFIVSEMRKRNYEPVCFHQDLFLVREDLANLVHSRASQLTARELYLDSFSCRSSGFRRWLMLERWNNKDIVRFEKRNVGKFRINPNSRLGRNN